MNKTHAKNCDINLPPIFVGGGNRIKRPCTCDGYHTWEELYEHRSMLFIALCHSNRAFARKSRVHEDGRMFDGMFIATLQTPDGQISYHLENKFWDLLDVQEKTESWDGHTSDDVLLRLRSL